MLHLVQFGEMAVPVLAALLRNQLGRDPDHDGIPDSPSGDRHLGCAIRLGDARGFPNRAARPQRARNAALYRTAVGYCRAACRRNRRYALSSAATSTWCSSALQVGPAWPRKLRRISASDSLQREVFADILEAKSLISWNALVGGVFEPAPRNSSGQFSRFFYLASEYIDALGERRICFHRTGFAKLLERAPGILQRPQRTLQRQHVFLDLRSRRQRHGVSASSLGGWAVRGRWSCR